MIRRRFSSLAAPAGALLLMLAGSGCGDDAERAVEDAAGIEEGSETRTADTDEEKFIVKETKEIVEADTGEVVGKEVSSTPVTVQEEKKVELDVDVESGETSTKTEGYVPEELRDQ